MPLLHRLRLIWYALKGLAPATVTEARAYGQGGAVTWGDDAEEQAKHYSHWVFTAVNKIGQAIAAAQLRFYVRSPKGPDTDEELDGAHPLYELFRTVNSDYTPAYLWGQTTVFWQLTGNAYWYKGVDRLGVPRELWIAPSQHMKVVADKRGRIAGYKYQTSYSATPIMYKRDEVIHFKLPNPLSMLYGRGPLQAAAESVDGFESMKESQRTAFKHGIFPMVAAQTDDVLTNNEAERIRRKLEDRYGGTATENKVIVLSHGLKVNPFTLAPREMDFLNSANLARDEILAIFGVPAAITGISKEVNRSSAEAMEYVFARWCVTPLLAILAESITQELCRGFDERIYAAFDSIVPEDEALQAKIRQDDVKAGILAINEARARIGLEPIDGGDEVYLEMNRVPLGWTAPEPETPATSPGEPEADEDFDEPDEEKTFSPVLKIAADELMDVAAAAEAFEVAGQRAAKQSLTAGAQREMARLGLPSGTWSLNDPQAVAFLALKERTYWQNTVVLTTQTKITRAVQDGMVEGEGYREIAKRIEAVFAGASRFRTTNIARTEVVGAYNAGGNQADINGGATHKDWIETADDLTRKDHIGVESVEITAPFIVGGEALQYPGDPNGSPAQTNSCRCTSAGYMQGKAISPEHKAWIITHVKRHHPVLERPFIRAMKREFKREMREILRNLRTMLPQETTSAVA